MTEDTSTTTSTGRPQQPTKKKASTKAPLSYNWTDPDYFDDERNYTITRKARWGADLDRLTNAQFDAEMLKREASVLPEGTLAAFNEALRGSPALSPTMGAAVGYLGDRLGVSMDTTLTGILGADAAALARASNRPYKPASQVAKENGWSDQFLKPLIRSGTALASMPMQFLVGMVRSAVGDFEDVAAGRELGADSFSELVRDAADQTYGGQMLKDLFGQQGPSDQWGTQGSGDGWFIGESSRTGQAQVRATRAAADLVHGRAWTLGRGSMSVIYDDPEDLGYKTFSGIIDGIVAVFADPTIIGSKLRAPVVAAERGARAAEGIQVSRETGEALAAQAERVAAEEQVTLLGQVVATTEEEMRLAQQAANDAVAARTAAEQTARGTANPNDLARATSERDTLLDHATRLAERRRQAPERVTRLGGQVTDQGRFRQGAISRPSDAELLMAVDEATVAYGDEGLDALFGEVTGLAGELPGLVTRDPLRAARRGGAGSAVPGAVDGVDGFGLWSRATDPRVVDIEDSVEDLDSLVAAVRQGLGGRSNARRRAVMQLTDAVTDGDFTYGDLLDHASQRNLMGSVVGWLRSQGVDGVANVFRREGGDGGYWWIADDVDKLRWDHGAFQRIERGYRADGTTLRAVRSRLTALDREIADLTRRGGAYQLAAAAAADNFAASATANGQVRTMFEEALGAWRNLDGQPTVNYDKVRGFLTGGSSELDDAVRARASLTVGQRAAKTAGLASEALLTSGIGPVARVGAQLATGPIARARDQLLDRLVASESPGEIWRLLGRGKVDIDTATALANAGTREQVLETFAPLLGTRLTGPLTVGPARTVATWRLAQRTTPIWGRTADYVRRMSAYSTGTGTAVDFKARDQTAQVLDNYLRSSGASVDEIDARLSDYMAQETVAGRAKSTMALFDGIAERYGEDIEKSKLLSTSAKERLVASVKKNTRIYQSARDDTSRWWLDRARDDSLVGYTTVDGQRISVTGPQLDSELASNGVVLPDVNDARLAMTRIGRAASQSETGERLLLGSREVLDRVSNFWRTAVLLRPAYWWRNTGEMQFRMFLAGHSSMFNDPAHFLAMTTAMTRRGRTAGRLQRDFAAWNGDLRGQTFTDIATGEAEVWDEAMSGFIDQMTRHGSMQDMREYRMAATSEGVRTMRPGDRGFNNGWADKLLMLRHSRIARIVAGDHPKAVQEAIAAGAPTKDAVVAYLLRHPGAAQLRKQYEEAGAISIVFSDEHLMRQFLFDSPDSVAEHLRQATAGRQELADYVATGRLLDADGAVLFAERRKGPTGRATGDAATVERTARQTKDLASALSRGKLAEKIDPQYEANLRVVKFDRTQEGVARRTADGFFRIAGRMEKSTSYGPEFAYSYWEKVAEMMPTTNAAARKEILGIADQQFNRSRALGGRRDILKNLQRAAKMPESHLTTGDIHAIAAGHAEQTVRDLFYAAHRKRQFWHAHRLAAPFGQPWANTMIMWGKLGARNPVNVYKLTKAMQGAQSAGSSVINDLFDAADPTSQDYAYDSSQGFVYRDSRTEELAFKVPLIGSALGAVASAITGDPGLAEAQGLAIAASSLNMAWTTDKEYLPGLGPMITMPLATVLPDDWWGAVPNYLREWAFPFGKPEQTGVLEAQAPTWMKRLRAAFGDQNLRASTIKPSMAYLVSTREYGDLTGDPAAQQRLVDDAMSLSAKITAIRALGAFVLPAAPLQDIYAADKDGNLIAAATLSDVWSRTMDAHGGDFEGALYDFADRYGENTLFAIVPDTSGDAALTGPAWEALQDNPKELEPYTDVLRYFYPGDTSIEASKWLKGTDRRRNLSPQEKEDEALRYLYQVRETRIEGLAEENDWDDDRISEEKDRLKAEFGGVVPSPKVPGGTLSKIRQAIDRSPFLAQTGAGQGARQLFQAYDTALAQVEDEFGLKTLRGQDAEDARMRFFVEMESIVAAYGSGDTGVRSIAQLFIREVGG